MNIKFFNCLKYLTVVSRNKVVVFPLHFSYSATATPITDFPSNLLSPLLQSLEEKCFSMKELKRLHAQIILNGLSQQTVPQSKLISFYAVAKCGDIQYARLLFDKIPQPNCHMYNSLIRGYSNCEDTSEAILLYKKMILSGILPNEFTFPFVLKACALKAAYRDGILIHATVVKLGYESQLFVQNGLINVYVGCREIFEARKVFGGMKEKSLISWNSMISGYSEKGCCQDAFFLFQIMKKRGIEPDDITFVKLLRVSSQARNLKFGRFLHLYIVINGLCVDIHVQNALLDMYGKGGDIYGAQTVFDQMVDRTVVSWTSLLNAYAKHGFLELAKTIFEQIPEKNVVSWNAMISSFLQEGCWQDALDLFFQMSNSGVKPDEVTLVSALSACSQLGNVVLGQKIHKCVSSYSVKYTVTVYNALIDMYSKCGSIEKAFDIFLEMPEKNIVSWNIMIGAFALVGDGHKAIQLFEEMQAGGMRPDQITFTGLLSACCHSGLIDIGQHYFEKMGKSYRLPYEIEHYACMVDILGRGGQLDAAVKLIGGMSMKPDAIIWGALLGACRIHRNISCAKQILKQLLELDMYTGGLYVLMSNIFCEAQRWEEMKKMRKLMTDHGIKKQNAVSSIEVSGCIHEFMVDEKRHEASNVIYALLDQLMDHLKSEEYLCSLSISTMFMETEVF